MKDIEQGVTLIEVLATVAIIVVLSAALFPLYGNLQVSSQLNENTFQLVQSLRIAKECSLGWQNNAGQGVYLQPGRYILYQGPSFVLRQSALDKEVVLAGSLLLSWNLTGTGDANDINFSKGLGAPNKVGSIVLTHSVNGVRNIEVNNFNIFEY